MPKQSKVLKCDLHDYFEIVCMRQSNVRFILKSGDSYQGVAKDIVQKEGQEFIQLLINASNIMMEIGLLDIQSMHAFDNPDGHNFDLRLD